MFFVYGACMTVCAVYYMFGAEAAHELWCSVRAKLFGSISSRVGVIIAACLIESAELVSV